MAPPQRLPLFAVYFSEFFPRTPTTTTKTSIWFLFQLSRVLNWGLEVETDIKCFQDCLVSEAPKGSAYTPFIPALWRQRQVDLWEFQASLMYIPGLHRELQASQSQQWYTTSKIKLWDSETAQVVRLSCENLSLIPGLIPPCREPSCSWIYVHATLTHPQ